ncbi:hypothetical protein U9M48_009540 [Paspalum notatum var. saurae]|uniref:Uncharacterized protein n=1 Tax=Paspalum notatum var. saurae TaxID=547442 RepID=A0AAQ3SSR7_PASNO
MTSLLKAVAAAIVAAVALLAATAEAAAGSFIPAIATRDFLTSTVFFWVTANAIVVWLLLSSSRRGRTTDGGDGDNTSSPSAGHDGEAARDAVVDSVYMSSSEYEAFSDAGGRRADAPVSKRLVAREARAARRSDRPRLRKKLAAGQDAPTPIRAVAAEAAREPDHEVRARSELVGTPVAAAAEFSPGGDGVVDDEEDVSMDTLWQSIVQRRAARPVVVQKSESWGNDELPRLQRVAETAAATPRREMRKSVSAVTKRAAAPEPRHPPPSVPSAIKQMGWRTRDVLVSISPDELLRRAESFIRRQREHLSLQRQESEQRQLLLRRRFYLPAPAAGPGPIRV